MTNKNEKQFEKEMFDIISSNNEDTAELFKLIDKYGVDFTDRDGRNILLNCIVKHFDKSAIAIIENAKDLDLNQQDNSGYSALHFAVQEGRIEIVKNLLKAKEIKVDIADCNGNTPLWRGIFDEIDEDIILLLLEKGADINQKNNHGVAPIEFVEDSMIKLKEWLQI